MSKSHFSATVFLGDDLRADGGDGGLGSLKISISIQVRQIGIRLYSDNQDISTVWLTERAWMTLRGLFDKPFPGGAEEADLAHENGEVLCTVCEDKGWFIPEDGQIGAGKRVSCNNPDCTAEWNGL